MRLAQLPEHAALPVRLEARKHIPIVELCGNRVADHPAIGVRCVPQEAFRRKVGEAVEFGIVLAAEHKFRVRIANEGRVGVALRNRPAIASAPVPGPEKGPARLLFGEGLQAVDFLCDHLYEGVGLRLPSGQQAHQANPRDTAHIVRLRIDEGRHDRNAQRLDALQVLGMREVGHARDQHVGPRRHQRIQCRRHVPTIADLPDLTRPGLAAQIIVIARVPANRDDPVFDSEYTQHPFMGMIVDGDPPDGRSDQRGTRQVPRQGRRLQASRNQHQAGALRRSARRSAPGDDGRFDVHNAVAVPFDDAEGLRKGRLERLACDSPRTVGRAGAARGHAGKHNEGRQTRSPPGVACLPTAESAEHPERLVRRLRHLHSAQRPKRINSWPSTSKPSGASSSTSSGHLWTSNARSQERQRKWWW